MVPVVRELVVGLRTQIDHSADSGRKCGIETCKRGASEPEFSVGSVKAEDCILKRAGFEGRRAGAV
jgi:hypothetical protein